MLTELHDRGLRHKKSLPICLLNFNEIRGVLLFFAREKHPGSLKENVAINNLLASFGTIEVISLPEIDRSWGRKINFGFGHLRCLCLSGNFGAFRRQRERMARSEEHTSELQSRFGISY